MTPASAPPELLLLLNEPAPAAGGGLTGMLLPMVAMIAIFYFILYRPQKREQEEHKKLLDGLVRGDRVVTTSGLHGRVHEVAGAVLLLDIAEGTIVTVDRESVRRKAQAPTAPEGTKVDAGADAGKTDAKTDAQAAKQSGRRA